ncbi:MAG: carbohydrate kinase family protein [Spirochaetaceae bacterium]|nr:carbohydrate kinase family protein [Spirochaetaceae bacterium]
MKKGITIVGSLILDKHYRVDAFPSESTLSTIQLGNEYIGGAGNLILDLAKIDSEFQIKTCGMIGSGPNGDTILEGLKAYPNINTDGIVYGDNTSITLVIDAQNNKSRTFFYYPGASDEFSIDDINWDLIDSDIFQLEYLLLLKKIDAIDKEYGTIAARILCEAKKRGFLTSVDMVSEKGPRASALVPFALKYTDFCTINEIEAQEITGQEIIVEGNISTLKIISALKILKKMGVSKWVIIHNSKYSIGLDCETNEIYKVPSLNIPKDIIIGTTGAGDAFCSGVLYSVYQGKNILDAMKFASATAGCSLFAYDGSSSMCDYKSIIKLYDKYKYEVEYEKI